LYKSVDFSKFSSIKVGSKVDVAILKDCDFNYKEYYLLGGCNNVLVGNNPPKLMMLDKKFNYIKVENNLLKVGGATPSGRVFSFCKKHNIANFEFLAHLPGKMGGVVFMNAGLKEFEVFDNLVEVTTCKNVLQKKDIDFGYRYTNILEPILEVAFELEEGFSEDKVTMFKKLRANQPSTPSAGSCFKNPKNDYAGRLIEAVGLKGFRVGAMEFSKQHANFLVNYGGGSFEDAIFLIEEAKKRVLKQFNIKLECEIKILEKGKI